MFGSFEGSGDVEEMFRRFSVVQALEYHTVFVDDYLYYQMMKNIHKWFMLKRTAWQDIFIIILIVNWLQLSRQCVQSVVHAEVKWIYLTSKGFKAL